MSSNHVDLMQVLPTDDEWYKERYKTLKHLTQELEDENNMLALKLAQTKWRLSQRKTALNEHVRRREEAVRENLQIRGPGPRLLPHPSMVEEAAKVRKR